MNPGFVPRRETPRLSQREWRTTDFEAYAAMTADADVMRFLGGHASGSELA